MEKKANLFIVGTMRSGTTLLMELFAKHPDIYVSPIKEPHYFVEDLPESLFEPIPFFNLDRYFEKDFPNHIHRAKIEKATDYEMLFSLANNENYRAEASISYLHAPAVVSKIKEYNSNSKIIIITRNPLQRSFSHYTMNKGLLREKRSFEEALKHEINLYQNDKLPWYSYLGMSFYDVSIQRFKKSFENNVTIIRAEDLFKAPNQVLKRLASDLQIEDFQNTSGKAINVSRELKYRQFWSPIKKIGLLSLLKRILPSQVKKFVFKMSTKPNSRNFELSDTIRKELKTIFEKESSSY